MYFYCWVLSMHDKLNNPLGLTLSKRPRQALLISAFGWHCFWRPKALHKTFMMSRKLIAWAANKTSLTCHKDEQRLKIFTGILKSGASSLISPAAPCGSSSSALSSPRKPQASKSFYFHHMQVTCGDHLAPQNGKTRHILYNCDRSKNTSLLLSLV